MADRLRTQCDCAILVALPEEFDTLTSMPTFGNGGRSRSGGDAIAFFSYARAGRQKGEGIVCLFGDMGPRARDATQRLMDKYDPAIVMSLGIAMKAHSDVGLGDVVVATSITNLIDGGKIGDSPGGGIRLEAAGDPVLPTKRATKALSAWWSGSSGIQKTFQLNSRKRFIELYKASNKEAPESMPPLPRVHFAHAACGPFVSASDEFANILKSVHRKTYSYDMESGYVGDVLSDIAPETWFLSIRGISDSGDRKKSELEISTSGIYRAWSTQNAASFVTEFLKLNIVQRPRNTRSSIQGENVSKVKRSQPRNNYKRLDISPVENDWSPDRFEWRALYPAQIVDRSTNIDKSMWNARYTPLVRNNPFPGGGLLEGIVAEVEKCRQTRKMTSMLVSGVKGTAKGTLLDVLYKLLANFPRAFIDLREYRDAGLDRDPESIVQQLLSKLRADFPRQVPLVLFVDKLRDDELTTSVFSAIWAEAIARPGSFLICGMNRFGDSYGPPGAAWDYCVELDRLNFEDPGVETLVRSFENAGIPSDELLAKVQALKHPEVDPKLVSVLLKYRSTPQFSTCNTMPQLAARFVATTAASELKFSENVALSRASEYAFRLYANLAVDEFTTTEINTFTAAIRWGAWIQNSLIALFVVESIKSLERTGDITDISYQALSSVYESKISNLVKQVALLREHEDRVLSGGRAALARKDLNILPVSLYVLGRLTDAGLKLEARKILRQVLEAGQFHRWRGAEDQRLLSLTRRSIYISLAYLGDAASAQEYAKLLFSNEQEASLNRGFHIEYYGDRPVRPSVGIQGYLLVDNGVSKWDKTRSKLSENLRARLGRDSIDALGIVEFATFCSFVASRRTVAMTDKATDEVREVLELGLRNRAMPAELRARAELLKDRRVRLADVIHTLYKLKHEERAGWRKRNVAKRLGHPTERVASHVYGALLLAYALLPDQPPGEFKYNKSNVLEYILLHDLGEAIVGDLTPEEKIFDPNAEELAVRRIAAYAALPELRKLLDLERKWIEFEHRMTPDALLARDFDLLDAWIQGYIYRPYFDSEDSFALFEQYHRESIKTPPGLEITEMLREELESLSKPIS